MRHDIYLHGAQDLLPRTAPYMHAWKVEAIGGVVLSTWYIDEWFRGMQSRIKIRHTGSLENAPRLLGYIRGTEAYPSTIIIILADGCEITARYHLNSNFCVTQQQQMIHGFYPPLLPRRRRYYVCYHELEWVRLFMTHP